MKFFTKSEVEEARRLNKLALIHARRSEDEEAQKRLSQERETLKRKRFCIICGVPIMWRSDRPATHCSMHHIKRLSMQMKTWLASCSLFLMCLCAFGAPSSQSGSVTLAWSYNYATNPGVTSWNIYVGTNATPVSGWDGTNVTCRCYQNVIATGVTNLTATVTGLVRGLTYYFTVTPTDGSAEGDYCNEVRQAVPPKPGKGSSLTIIGVQ